MKKVFVVITICVVSLGASAQGQEAQQLLLNWEKLAQLKTILKNMYKGYQVVSAGYNRIKDISEGNFKLHHVFLDGLLEVSPLVRKYQRVADIITYQGRILEEQKKALNYFKATGNFTPKEIVYMTGVYRHLLGQSLKNLDELFMVITARQLRMSDNERLRAIDRIFQDMQDKLTFLRSFNNSTKVLSLQRQQEKAQIEISKKISGIE